MHEPAKEPPAREGVRITIRGTVQGVGMRPFVYRVARAEGLAGRVRNDGRGVTIEAFGDSVALSRFLERIRAERPPASGFDELACERIAAEPVDEFLIADSEAPGAAEPRVSIPADLATCPECLAEVRDPAHLLCLEVVYLERSAADIPFRNRCKFPIAAGRHDGNQPPRPRVAACPLLQRRA